ncbi:hypothetical protein BCV70DRAFT_63531 [Testicularia cyperi]|uniref:Uncharacterized protein n=1 Tax=Testicularia cyperi TaxID=1882483 RepID=A0A317XYF3_9BASI|nr:hypothetical protein BCV70DRAFT_63531 [Testicularia cyperi]
MPEHIALYVLAGSSVSPDAVLAEIRASDYIDEINSGEGPREECGLYNLVQPAPSQADSDDDAKLLQHHAKLTPSEWNSNCFLLADSTDPTLVTIYELHDGNIRDKIRAKARSALEVVSNVSVANMSIKEYKEMCGNADIYDAGQ